MLFGVLFRGTFAILSVQDTLSPKDSIQNRGHREKKHASSSAFDCRLIWMCAYVIFAIVCLGEYGRRAGEQRDDTTTPT